MANQLQLSCTDCLSDELYILGVKFALGELLAVAKARARGFRKASKLIHPQVVFFSDILILLYVVTFLH